MSVASEFENANKAYASNFTKGDLALPPGRKVIVVACMDARLDPARALGLEEGDAHVIRNAGGRTVEALRSVVISQQLLGTREIVIVHHVCEFLSCIFALIKLPEFCCSVRGYFKYSTKANSSIEQTDCGMLTFSDTDVRSKIKEELNENADHIAFLPFKDLKQSVIDDVEVLKKSPLVLDVPITGYVYDVKTGKIDKV